MILILFTLKRARHLPEEDEEKWREIGDGVAGHGGCKMTNLFSLSFIYFSQK